MLFRSFVADGLASDRSVAQVMLSLPVAGIVGVAVGALAPHPKLAWRLLAALVCLVGVPIWVIFGLALGGSLSSATSTAALDRFDIEQGFLLVAWQLLVLHLICTALAAGGLLAGRWVRARRMLHQRPR